VLTRKKVSDSGDKERKGSEVTSYMAAKKKAAPKKKAAKKKR
jgi:hypothetical protein